ncbi:hypothetical protein KFE25_002157 [Diacronema lutheri]|uniref:Uncharacterized protein n=1 Tax=Diacronema lutheri TaxID=2081491 RepID=A0A8J6CCR8_DIALT|nr:hypothetical protein KFE25_002157 [Diacronema lutheri]
MIERSDAAHLAKLRPVVLAPVHVTLVLALLALAIFATIFAQYRTSLGQSRRAVVLPTMDDLKATLDSDGVLPPNAHARRHMGRRAPAMSIPARQHPFFRSHFAAAIASQGGERSRRASEPADTEAHLGDESERERAPSRGRGQRALVRRSSRG